MSEKPLCGHCYQEYHEKCCDKTRINVLERQLEEARERLTIAVNCMPKLAKMNYEKDCKELGLKEK